VGHGLEPNRRELEAIQGPSLGEVGAAHRRRPRRNQWAARPTRGQDSGTLRSCEGPSQKGCGGLVQYTAVSAQARPRFKRGTEMDEVCREFQPRVWAGVSVLTKSRLPHASRNNLRRPCDWPIEAVRSVRSLLEGFRGPANWCVQASASAAPGFPVVQVSPDRWWSVSVFFHTTAYKLDVDQSILLCSNRVSHRRAAPWALACRWSYRGLFDARFLR
jgi:hypothetical protein